MYHAANATRELNQFARHYAAHAGYGCDTVTDFFNNTDFFQIDVYFIILNFFSQSFCDACRFVERLVSDLYFTHQAANFFQLTSGACIENFVANFNDDAANY
ncbi:hypothetical protein SDC9_106451 [bioreactor metagenome]|uniref:Uncharacterized protein n=1 Tax=bioreactor metagenome TaxID=1076179 RepID=A0A645B3F4_9ZZZZ